MVPSLSLILLGCRPEAPLLPMTVTPTVRATPPVGVTLVTQAAPTTAVLQTTPLPLTIPSPTLPATPIVYTVVEGDTLLGIAIQRQTTVDDILALNPEVRPELLQIGQSLILPPPATPLAQEAVGTAVPIQVAVKRIDTYQTPVGGLWLLGEVTNRSDLPAANVQVAIILLDGAGEALETAAAWAASPVILPGASSPFGVLVDEMPVGFERPSVSVIGGEAVIDLGNRYVDVIVKETAVAIQGDRIRITGQVENVGAVTADQITITATFYNDQGGVTGYYQTQLADSLLPAETAPFDFSTAPPGGATVDANFFAQALAVGG